MREERKTFYAENSDRVMTDSIKGSGEHLAVFAALSGCRDLSSRILFQSAIKKSFAEIYFRDGKEVTPNQIGDRVNRMIEKIPDLRKLCKMTS
jgi:hypothetical protein